MQIYADPITVNCRKVLAGLKLMDAPYELVHVDYFKGEQKAEPYASLNPNLSIPAMKDGDLVLWESNAILWLLAEGTRFMPSTPLSRARTLQWMFFEQYSHEPYVATPRFIVRHLPEDSPRRRELPAHRGRDRPRGPRLAHRRRAGDASSCHRSRGGAAVTAPDVLDVVRRAVATVLEVDPAGVVPATINRLAPSDAARCAANVSALMFSNVPSSATPTLATTGM